MDRLFDELTDWQKEITKKDSVLSKSKPVHDKQVPTVRRVTEISVDEQKPKGLDALTPELKQKKTPANNTAKADAEKAKGNEFFKNGDFDNAQICYSRAIEINPTVSIYFVNRAMTYLKLNNYIEAERDATRGIKLDPKNTKAYWRRGIALRNLGRLEEAQSDFLAALKIEPKNATIAEELKTLAIQKVDLARKKADHKARVMPINVIEGDCDVKELERRFISDKGGASKSEPKKKPIQNVHAQPVSNTPGVQKAAAAQHEKKAPATNSPFIQKAAPIQPVEQLPVLITPTAQNATVQPFEKLTNTSLKKNPKIQPVNIEDITQDAPKTDPITQKQVNSTPVQTNTTVTSFTFSTPHTNFEFERDWKTCQARGDDVLFHYFKSIPPSSFSKLFKSSLESKYFEDMIHILSTKYDTPESIFDVLEGLSGVKRLDMLVMFLSKKQEKDLKNLFEKVKLSEVPPDKLARVVKLYKIRI